MVLSGKYFGILVMYFEFYYVSLMDVYIQIIGSFYLILLRSRYLSLIVQESI